MGLAANSEEKLLSYFKSKNIKLETDGKNIKCILPNGSSLLDSEKELLKFHKKALIKYLGLLNKVEEIYTLTPLQEGLLFHYLHTPESDQYCVQVTWHYSGDFQPALLKSAWEQVVACNAVLRTRFVWEQVEKPFQVVHSQVLLPWFEENWSHLSAIEQQQKLADYLLKDRAAHFDLAEPCLMRLHLVYLGNKNYQFIWSKHHIILDGWCNSILLSQLNKCYQAVADNKVLQPSISPSYARYIQWLGNQDKEAAYEFWRQELSDINGPTALNINKPGTVLDPNKPIEVMETYERNLPALLTQQLQQCARRYRVTLNTVVQFAWAYVLSQYSGETDVVYGTTVSGRSHPLPDIEKMVGLLINSVAMRVRFNFEETVAVHLQKLHAKFQAVDQYSYLSLNEVQKCSAVAMGTPLFYSRIVFENYPIDEDFSTASGLKISNVKHFIKTNYPLLLVIVPCKQIRMIASYDAACFEFENIERFLKQIENVLTALIEQIDQPLYQLSLFSAAERQALITQNQGPSHPVSTNTLISLFESHVKRTPQTLAVVSADGRLSYAELDQRATALARYLRQQGVSRESLVAISLERSVNFLVGMLAILKAGGAYVPLETDIPLARCHEILADSGIRWLLTDTENQPKFQSLAASCINLDEEWERDNTVDFNLPTIQPDQLAYVIYTSGSTGKPKGVMIEHRQLVNYIEGVRAQLQLNDVTSFATVSTLAADLGYTSLWGALGSGRTVHLLPKALGFDAHAFADYLQQEQVDCLKIVPSHLLALLNSVYAENVLPQKCLILGGEASHWSLLKQIKTLRPNLKIINHYGPTETTVGALTYHCQDNAVSESTTVPIGRPLPNTYIYILNAQGQLVPPGCPGELYIGGAGVGRGYLGQAELTAERFVEDRFISGQRLYRTGDKVRQLSDGTLEYLGRLDNQVKLHGYRIELGEIETVLTRHGDVQTAVVVAQADSVGNLRLVAYVVPGEFTPTVSELKNYLAQHLPAYMVPAHYQLLTSLPLTANGKLDKRALPAVEGESNVLDYVAPRTPLEQQLAAIWCELLKQDRIGVHDNFFELGGHSLLSIRMITRIKDQLNCSITIKLLFEYPTIATLAQEIEKYKTASTLEKTDKITVIDRNPDAKYSLSFSQKRMWFLEQLNPGKPIFTTSRCIRIRGNLDITRFENSIKKIMIRHEVFRTVFKTENGEPYAVVQPHQELATKKIDLTLAHQESLSDEAIENLLAKESKVLIDIVNGPLFHHTLIKLSEVDYMWVFNIHHMISDGWSLAILMREITANYNAPPLEDNLLPSLKIQYLDYAHYQNEYMAHPTRQRQINYWREKLSDLPLLDFPLDKPRPALKSNLADYVEILIPETLTVSLENLSNRCKTSVFNTLLATFWVLLNKYTGQTDITIGTLFANRDSNEIENLIGLFVNVLAIRINLSEEASFSEILSRTHAITLEAFQNQDVPFEKIVEELSVAKNLARHPIYDVMLVFHNTPSKIIDFSDLKLSTIDLRREGNSVVDLRIDLERFESTIKGYLVYDKALFQHDSMQRLVKHFLYLLENVVKEQAQPISNLSVLNETEKDTILRAWNNTEVTYKVEKNLHQYIESIAKKYPENIALVFENTTLTYGELNQSSDQLAQYLVCSGLVTKPIVGVCMERSIDLVVALLAILKAGAAYLPLDPEYPESRLAEIIADSSLNSVLIHKKFSEKIKTANIHKIAFEELGDKLKTNIATPISNHRLSDLAYVIYTSGSTGKPKGVAIDHQAIVNRLLWMQQQFNLNSTDAVLQKTPYSFDVSVWEFFWPLMVGAKLVIAKPDGHKDPKYLIDTINQHKITTLHFVPSMLNLLLDNDQIKTCKSIKQMICSGEALPYELKERFYSLLNANLINLYGPTEAAVDVSYWDCGSPSDKPIVPIGKPIANVTLYILDKFMKPVPPNVVGELYIGGVCLAKGYLNNHKQTAEKFVMAPKDIADGRLYKTGDLARFVDEGIIEFLGRIDHQIKIRGFRVELEEIEYHLNSDPIISKAVVLVEGNNEINKRLVAYISLKQAGMADKNLYENIMQSLSMKLPDYMLPSNLVFIDEIPVTSNGKLDRKKLAQVSKHDMPDPIQIKPRNVVEKIINQIWAEVLNIQDFGVTEDFFRVGGNSLSAVRVSAKLSDIFQIQLPLSFYFKKTTIAMIAKDLMENPETQDQVKEVAIIAQEIFNE